MSKIRVVIVDDEPDVRLLLRLQLQSAGDVEVVGEAGDGIGAVTTCAEQRPDVVIMDLLLPRMMGLQAIEQLAAEHPAVGVVAYSATASEFVRSEADRLGVPLLLKTGDIGSMLAAIRDVAGRPRP